MRNRNCKEFWEISRMLIGVFTLGLGGIGSIFFGIALLFLGIISLSIEGIMLGIGFFLLGILALTTLIIDLNRRGL